MEAEGRIWKCTGCGKAIDLAEFSTGVCTRCDGILPPRKDKRSSTFIKEDKHHGTEKK